MIEHINNIRTESTLQDRYLKLKKRFRKLQAENEELQKQLDKFDEKVFDQIRDLERENERLKSALQSIINMEIPQYPADGAFKSAIKKAKQALEDAE